ncbi:calcium release-activated calcium channel protein 1 [Orussus abietinus]|uniref:calcium release-activated calcium channel protein 1 n=1 Tax=Orussus abietinus TaxID=222816 RepID=UPI0006259139|nr:calcium release-activated calcium channel protein 1 [Orussus abietinus]
MSTIMLNGNLKETGSKGCLTITFPNIDRGENDKATSINQRPEGKTWVSLEEVPNKLTKSTQIDFSQSTWKLGNPSHKLRPMSATYLQKSNQLGDSSYTPKQILHSAQSEIILSPRNRHHSKYVALDMMKPIPSPPYSPYSGSQLSGSNTPCTCCCACGSHVPQSPVPPNSEEQDGPEGLSWRRLHMSRAKLKATATTSELLSGFAMVAMVELQINDPTEVPEWLFIMFAVCTTVLVSVHIFALMISTYLLPNIEAISKLQVARLVTESPHERMRGFIELAWAFSTVLGLFLFLVEVAILCWVKFWDYSTTAATASTIIVIPVLIVFVAFAVHFYHSLVVYKCESSVSDMNELESIKRNLDNVTIGQTNV